MSDSSNYSATPTMALTTGSLVPIQSEGGLNGKTTVDAIATYVAGAGKAVTGTFSGSITSLGYEVFTPSVMTATGIVPSASYIQLDSATPKIAASITPTIGLYLVVSQKDGGTIGHTLTTAGTFDGTNNTATFAAANKTLILFGVSTTRWVIVANVGSVALSNV